jgi:hypothetical protein
MTTEHQQRLAGFYDEVVRRAYTGACNHWCRSGPNLETASGVALFPPAGGYVRDEFLAAWPTVAGKPGFILDCYAVEQAFTRILKLDSDIDISPGSTQTRKHLHVAEQEADARVLSNGHVDLVVQIAVFDRVVFAL